MKEVPRTAWLELVSHSRDTKVSCSPLPPATLASLPNELLKKIGQHIAPQGGQPIGNLRLASRRFSTLFLPLSVASIEFATEPTKLDSQFATLIREGQKLHGLNEKILSVKLDIPEVGVELLAAILLTTLPALGRLHLVGENEPLPDPLFETISNVPALRTLILEDIDLNGRWDVTSWAPQVVDLAILDCTDGEDVLLDSEDDTKPCRNFLQRLEFEPDSSLKKDEATSRIVTALLAPERESKDIVLHWPSARMCPYITSIIDESANAWLVDDKLPFSLTLKGLDDLFKPKGGKKDSIAVAQILNWIGGTGALLNDLSLPVGKTFVVHEELLSMSLSKLETLKLVTKSEDPYQLLPDLLSTETFQQLARFITPATFPRLKSLHLRGWIDTSTASAVANTSRSRLPVEQMVVFLLLGFLRSTTLREVRFENSAGHSEVGSQCVFWREGKGEWEKRLAVFL
ncbi:hypothetical protein P7C70_g6272, partial [Phenoliferia sp. Uapishka_3]